MVEKRAKIAIEISEGSVEKAVVEAYKVGRRGGTLRKIRLEGRAVTFIWDEQPKQPGPPARRFAALLRTLAAWLDPGTNEPQGGQDGDRQDS